MLLVVQTDKFKRWLRGLRDAQGRAKLVRRLERVQKEAFFGDMGPVGEGVSEMRDFHGPGYRMYLVRRGDTVVVMLGGGDKDSQEKDIKDAKADAKALVFDDPEEATQ